MTLDARRIALQGIGYAALFIALQGFAPVDVPSPPLNAGGTRAPSSFSAARPDIERDDEEVLQVVAMALLMLG